MREFRFEEIAMSTRVALPMFLGCRMSELRRHHVPSPTPQQQQQEQQQQQQQQHTSAQAQVRRNLFGPIDHDENLKFVQNELTKISQADCKKWNFDFESEKPLQDGRFKWQPVVEGVPQAYEMPRLNCLSSATTSAPEMKPRLTCLRSSATTTSAASGTTTTTIIASKPSSSLLPPSVPECESTTTTTTAPPPPPPNKTNITATSIHDKASNLLNLTTATYRHSKPNNNNSSRPSSQPRPSCSKDIKLSSSSTTPSSDFVVVKKSDNRNSDLSSDSNQKQPSKASLPPVKHTRTRSTQPSVTDFMKIRKPKRVSTTKLEDEQPPALVKRSKTTTS